MGHGATGPKLSISQRLERFERNWFIGFSPKTLKHHYSLIPILFCNVLGLTWAAYFTYRTLVYNPDSTFLRKDNYERYRDGRDFQFFNYTGIRPSSKAPIYRRDGDPADESYELTFDGIPQNELQH